MTKAIVLHKTGGPEVLCWETITDPVPDPGEVLVRHEAVGLNYIDIYHRSGLYPLPALPAVIGMEGAGVVVSLGSGVEGFAVGDRVAYAAAPPGAYCQLRAISAKSLVRLPADISFQQAAAMMLKGLTAEYLLFRTHKLVPGQTVLVHAAAGGMGLILCQWARHLGARVIGTVGSQQKADLAKRHGCHEVIFYRRENFARRVQEITSGQGADVVYDAVGRDTFEGSLESLALFGHLVMYGQASGPVPSFDPARLGAKSACLTRPVLFHYTQDRSTLESMAVNLFQSIKNKIVSIKIGGEYPLAEASRAHADLESRRTSGSIVLLP